MDFVIEKGVEKPSSRSMRESKYPFSKMVPGDSVKIDDLADRITIGSILSMIKRKSHGAIVFATKTMEENGKRYLRVWRIK